MSNDNKEAESKMGKESNIEISNNIDLCINLLEKLSANADLLATVDADKTVDLLKAAGKFSRPTRHENLIRRGAQKKENRRKVVEQERKARAATGIRRARESDYFSAPKQITSQIDGTEGEATHLKSPRNCYVCKTEFTELHFFYDSMCPKCADFNYKKRFQTADLTDRVALITGSRLKIGYQATLMMLRAGATVIATTRFPVDSALRYAKEDDYPEWRDRLQIYGLDLRHTPSVEIFCSYIEQKYERLDLLINNAAQTVRRPPGFYAHLMENETKSRAELPDDARHLLDSHELCIDKLVSFSGKNLANEAALPVSWDGKSPGIGIRESAKLSQIPYAYDKDNAQIQDEIFPVGKLDADLQQVDLRTTNSWRLRLGDIQTSEMLEIQLVNSVAPFVLCNRLVSLMRKDNTGEKHVVNVSAMEGKFHRFKKADRHPHTNMAKAALNMLTHTSASDLAKDGIFMNAVDTGWVTDEDPAALSQFKQDKHDFQPPLDIVDGAARVCDPFFHGILSKEHWCGKFLKDYFPIDW